MKRNLLILMSMLSFLSCKTTKDLPTVEELNLNKYSGLWYEIARLPNKFEKGLECVTATYTLKDNGKIEVLNKGFSSEKGAYKTAKGTAWLPDKDYPGRLKVSFFWPFAGNYYIVTLDKDYTYALVGDPSRKYLWVLARTKTLDPLIYSKLMDTAKTDGFDITQMIKINQDCD